jgi:DNA repair exonuclease SbcCD ATPase subunit
MKSPANTSPRNSAPSSPAPAPAAQPRQDGGARPPVAAGTVHSQARPNNFRSKTMIVMSDNQNLALDYDSDASYASDSEDDVENSPPPTGHARAESLRLLSTLPPLRFRKKANDPLKELTRDEVIRKYRTLEGEYTELSDDLRKWQQQVVDIITHKNNEIENLDAEIVKLTAQISSSNTKASDLDLDNTNLRAQLQKTQELQSQLQEQLQQTNKLIEEKERLREEANKRLLELENLPEKLRQASEKLSQTSNELKGFKETNQTAANLIEKLTTERDSLRERNKNLQASKKSLKSQLQEKERQREELEFLTQQLEAQLASAKSINDNLEAQIQQAVQLAEDEAGAQIDQTDEQPQMTSLRYQIGTPPSVPQTPAAQTPAPQTPRLIGATSSSPPTDGTRFDPRIAKLEKLKASLEEGLRYGWDKIVQAMGDQTPNANEGNNEHTRHALEATMKAVNDLKGLLGQFTSTQRPELQVDLAKTITAASPSSSTTGANASPTSPDADSVEISSLVNQIERTIEEHKKRLTNIRAVIETNLTSLDAKEDLEQVDGTFAESPSPAGAKRGSPDERSEPSPAATASSPTLKTDEGNRLFSHISELREQLAQAQEDATRKGELEAKIRELEERLEQRDQELLEQAQQNTQSLQDLLSDIRNLRDQANEDATREENELDETVFGNLFSQDSDTPDSQDNDNSNENETSDLTKELMAAAATADELRRQINGLRVELEQRDLELQELRAQIANLNTEKAAFEQSLNKILDDHTPDPGTPAAEVGAGASAATGKRSSTSGNDQNQAPQEQDRIASRLTKLLQDYKDKIARLEHDLEEAKAANQQNRERIENLQKELEQTQEDYNKLRQDLISLAKANPQQGATPAGATASTGTEQQNEVTDDTLIENIKKRLQELEAQLKEANAKADRFKHDNKLLNRQLQSAGSGQNQQGSDIVDKLFPQRTDTPPNQNSDGTGAAAAAAAGAAAGAAAATVVVGGKRPGPNSPPATPPSPKSATVDADELQRQIGELREEIQRLNNQIEQKKKTLQDLNGQLTEAQRQHNEKLRGLDEQIKRKEETLRELDNQIADSQEKITQAAAAAATPLVVQTAGTGGSESEPNSPEPSPTAATPAAAAPTIGTGGGGAGTGKTEPSTKAATPAAATPPSPTAATPAAAAATIGTGGGGAGTVTPEPSPKAATVDADELQRRIQELEAANQRLREEKTKAEARASDAEARATQAEERAEDAEERAEGLQNDNYLLIEAIMGGLLTQLHKLRDALPKSPLANIPLLGNLSKVLAPLALTHEQPPATTHGRSSTHTFVAADVAPEHQTMATTAHKVTPEGVAPTRRPTDGGPTTPDGPMVGAKPPILKDPLTVSNMAKGGLSTLTELITSITSTPAATSPTVTIPPAMATTEHPSIRLTRDQATAAMVLALAAATLVMHKVNFAAVLAQMAAGTTPAVSILRG